MNTLMRVQTSGNLIARNRCPATTGSSTAKLFLLIGSLLLALVAVANIITEPEPSSEWPYWVSVAFLFWALIYLFATYKYFRTCYLFLSAYILCLAVFHLGHLFAQVFGLYDLQYLTRGEMAFWYQLAAWYVNLAFACIGVGAALALQPGRAMRSPIKSADSREIEANLNYAYWIGFALLLAASVALVLVLGSVGNILQYSRAQIFEGIGDTRGLGFFLLVAPSAMVLMVATAHTKIQRRFSYTVCLLLVLTVFFLGYRSSVLFPGLIAAILWIKLGKKIPTPVAIVAVLIVLIAIPSVRYLRAQGSYQEISTTDLRASFEESRDTKNILIELGGVSSVVAYVIKTVPEEWPFRYGQSYLLAIEQAIPNVGRDAEDSFRTDFLSRGFVDRDALSTMHPADWYTYIVDRWLFDRGGGAGFSTIAEAYLNFGAMGIVFYFSGLGFLLARLDQVDLRTSPKLLVFSGAMIWPLLKTVRNSFGVFLKPVAFIVVSIIIWRVVTFWINKGHR